MRARHAVAAAFAALAGLAAPQLAQAQPPPAPPVSPPPSTQAQARSTWSFDVSADGSWYENAYFVGAPDTAWSTSGRASLGHESRFREGSFSIEGFGGGVYYPEIDSFNQPIYGGSLGLGWTPSRRTTLKLQGRFEKTNTRYLQSSFGPIDPEAQVPPSTGAEGLPLPTSGTDVAVAAIGLEQRLSQRWQLNVDSSYNYWRFDDERLTGSEQLYASTSLGRQMGRRGLLYVTYAYSSSWFEDGKQRSHQALFGGRHTVERGLGIDVAGGVGYVESTEEFYPSGRLVLSAVGRRARLELGYHRDFGQAYGYARQTIGDLAFGRVSWSAVRKLTFDAGYYFDYRHDPADEDYTIKSGSASAGLNWDVGGGLGFGARYFWERNETAGAPVVEGGRATATLTYGVSWH